MNTPAKFEGMTDQQIAAYLNTTGNLNNLVSYDIAWLLTEKQPIFNSFTFETLEDFNVLLTTVDLSNDLTSIQIISVTNDPILYAVQKTKTVTETTDDTPPITLVKESRTIKLNIPAFAAKTASGPGASLSDIIASASFLNQIAGVVSILDMIAKGIPSIQTLSQSFSQTVNSIYQDFYSSLQSLSSSLQNFPVPDIKNNTDPGFGFINGLGGTNNTGSFLSYGGVEDKTPQPSQNTEVYAKLESVINTTLRQDWRAKNAKPGNPLILEAYAISGRNYDRDGNTGEYAWAAPFVSWVLYKAGLPYLKVMSPRAYAGYGNPVEIGTLKKIRKYDIIVFGSASSIWHIGFVMSINKNDNTISVLGGNQAGTAKITKFPITQNSAELYISHIRRNWAIPADRDTPLIPVTLPTRPGQQTSGVVPAASTGGRTRYTPETPAERIDRLSSGPAASGGILL